MFIDITVNPGSTKKNKTGGWRTFIPHTDKEHCISCGTCARVCPENCIKMIIPPPSEGGAGGGSGEGRPKPETDYDFCKGCGLCAEECPVKVIKMELEKK
jgi:pyruvate ferredoxin oxidoreductase delta subunit